MSKLIVLALCLTYLPNALAQSVFATIQHHADVNQRAMDWAVDHEGQVALSPSPEVAGATIRYDDGEVVFAQFLQLQALKESDLEILGFDFPREPGLTYYGVEIARPYLLERPDVLSPVTQFRILGTDAEGRVFWFGKTKFEVVSIESLIQPLGLFHVVGTIGSGASSDNLLLDWKMVDTPTDYYRRRGEAAVFEACSEKLDETKKPKPSLFDRLFGPRGG